MTNVYIVRAEDGGCPESFVMGLYPTEKLANERIEFLKNSEDYCFQYVWFNKVEVGVDGADFELCNR
jgi:hypothetical protein